MRTTKIILLITSLFVIIECSINSRNKSINALLSEKYDSIETIIKNDTLLVRINKHTLHPNQAYFYAQKFIYNTYKIIQGYEFVKITMDLNYYDKKDLSFIIIYNKSELNKVRNLIIEDTNYLNLINYVVDSISSLEISYVNSFMYEKNKLIARNIGFDFKDLLICYQKEQFFNEKEKNCTEELKYLYKIFSVPEFDNLPEYKYHICKILNIYKLICD